MDIVEKNKINRLISVPRNVWKFRFNLRDRPQSISYK